MLLLSWIPLGFGRHSLTALIVGIVMLDLAVQAVHVSNQCSIFRLLPEARNRINAAYMTCYFFGGAAGSLISAYVYSSFGWTGVIWMGSSVSALELLYFWLNRKSIE